MAIRRLGSWRVPALAFYLSVQLVGCATPGQRLRESAEQLGMIPEVREGIGFKHQLFFSPSTRAQGIFLHVYLEGDGTPWLAPGRPALDPTPQDALMLRLMAMDQERALYLGRPCYSGRAFTAECHPWYWTHGRYSEPVIRSLQTVLKAVVAELDVERLVFIGHSGGGTLAMLLAERFPETSMVVTLAGNLDPERWAERHGYTPLRASLNPARRAPLPRNVRQIHLVGADDRVVPPELIKEALKGQEHARIRVIPDLDHVCCWEQHWPELLRHDIP